MENTIRYKPEAKTVLQTGSTNNLTTETVIDAISMAIPIFLGARFALVYMSTLLALSSPRNLRWPTDTGSSYNLATRNDINTISAAAAMF